MPGTQRGWSWKNKKLKKKEKAVSETCASWHLLSQRGGHCSSCLVGQKKFQIKPKKKSLPLNQGFPTFILPCTPSAFRQVSMYPFSISTDKYVPLQHFDRCTCTPKISYESCHRLWQYILSWLFIDIFNNKHIMIFEKNRHWYMCKYLEINYMQMCFALLLITLNVPLRIGKCTPGGTCTPSWEPLL